jgi:polar amino acid transport system substrate-binding protein
MNRAAGLLALLLPCAALARPLSVIQQSGTIGLCVQEDSAPFANRQTQHGIFIDVGTMIAQQLGVTLTLDWIVSADYVRKTDCDAVPAAADIPSDDPLRRTAPWFGVPFAIISGPSHPPIRAMADLKAGPVAVLAESYARQALGAQGISLRVAFLENDEIMAAVAKGEPATGVVPLYSLQWYRHTHADVALRDDPAAPIMPELSYNASFELRGADQALQQRIDTILRSMVADGRIREIFARYGLVWQRP